MNIDKHENKGIALCLDRLREHLRGAKFHVRRTGTEGPDVLLTFLNMQLAGEFKPRIATRAQARHAVLQARAHAAKGTRPVIFANWIPEAVAEELRKEGVFFADAAGNAYLWDPPRIGIDIRGMRPPERPGAEPGRIVEPGGLKVCHLLLTDPRALRLPLREIAARANVALGTAHAVVKELKAAGYLVPTPGRGRRFGDWKGLLDTFVRGYALKLRPACIIGRYRHTERAPDGILKALGNRLPGGPAPGWALTGGTAARELTRHLEPDAVTLFVDEPAEEALKAEPMLPDRQGNVTLLRLFAPTAAQMRRPGGLPVATPLLVYAELLVEGGPRELETAEMIFERYLSPRDEE